MDRKRLLIWGSGLFASAMVPSPALSATPEVDRAYTALLGGLGSLSATLGKIASQVELSTVTLFSGDPAAQARQKVQLLAISIQALTSVNAQWVDNINAFVQTRDPAMWTTIQSWIQPSMQRTRDVVDTLHSLGAADTSADQALNKYRALADRVYASKQYIWDFLKGQVPTQDSDFQRVQQISQSLSSVNKSLIRVHSAVVAYANNRYPGLNLSA